MPKRTFWLTAGVALGAGSTLWAERRVRRTIEQTAAKLAPDALVPEVGRTDSEMRTRRAATRCTVMKRSCGPVWLSAVSPCRPTGCPPLPRPVRLLPLLRPFLPTRPKRRKQPKRRSAPAAMTRPGRHEGGPRRPHAGESPSEARNRPPTWATKLLRRDLRPGDRRQPAS